MGELRLISKSLRLSYSSVSAAFIESNFNNLECNIIDKKHFLINVANLFKILAFPIYSHHSKEPNFRNRQSEYFSESDRIYIILHYKYRMLKKNSSEKRFNTAAARIMISRKLPSDFFLPSR